MNTSKLIHIFRAGKHTDINGQTVDLTEADLAASAAAYDPAKHEAPLVVGHPTHDAPAYGWAKSLIATGADLEAEPDQLDPAFAEMVNDGRFKKRSAAFYRPDSPANPVPGVYYLHHIGFLGALPPAVKGLRGIKFGASDDGVVKFGGYEDATGQQLNTGTTIVTEAEIAALKAENERLKAECAADAKRRADEELKRRRTEAVAFAESLVGADASGKARLAVKHKEILVDLFMLAGQPGADGGVVMFGEGDGRQPALDALKAMFTEMPPVLSFGEQATADRAGGKQAGLSDADVARRANAYQAKMREAGQVIAMGEAVDAVNAGLDREA